MNFFCRFEGMIEKMTPSIELTLNPSLEKRGINVPLLLLREGARG
jgi:hypothetical protein